MTHNSVMSTNDDASECKRFAVEKRYWHDPFIKYFVKKVVERKTPEISRGYFVRHWYIKNMTEQFIQITDQNCQIVNIGAGFDTLYWNLFEENRQPKYGFYEIDFRQVVQRKCHLINSRPELKQYLKGDVAVKNDEIRSEFYLLFAADVIKIEEIDKKLMEMGINKTVPTLFIAECVLVYIPIDGVGGLFNYISKHFSTVAFLDYDPINLHDKFGEVMRQNLRGRQCNLVGSHHTLDTKLEFMRKYFKESTGSLLVELYEKLDQKEKQRIERLEFLDEVELLSDLLQHYSMCLSYNDNKNLGLCKLCF